MAKGTRDIGASVREFLPPVIKAVWELNPPPPEDRDEIADFTVRRHARSRVRKNYPRSDASAEWCQHPA